MHFQRLLTLALVLLFSSVAAHAAIGDGQLAVLKKPVNAQPRPEPKVDDAVTARDTGEKACQQAVDAATVMSEKVRQVSNEIVPLMVQTGQEFAHRMEPTLRELEPKMRELAERLRDVARQMEQSLAQPPTGSPDKR